MMWDFSGILYRVWTVGGTIFLLGAACLLLSKIGKKDFDKNCCVAGIFSAVIGVAAIIYYLFCGFYP